MMRPERTTAVGIEICSSLWLADRLWWIPTAQGNGPAAE